MLNGLMLNGLMLNGLMLNGFMLDGLMLNMNWLNTCLQGSLCGGALTCRFVVGFEHLELWEAVCGNTCPCVAIGKASSMNV
jgi:hypothetical protein